MTLSSSLQAQSAGAEPAFATTVNAAPPSGTPRGVSWPMYAIDEAAVAAFWADLRDAMRAAGLAATPNELSHPGDLSAHWRDPALLLSQTCGFPLVTALRNKVRYVCTPRFSAAGCDGAIYRSAIIVRSDEPVETISQCAGRRAAYNSRDSQSGYNALRFLVAPHARDGRFFAATIETGSHRSSLAAVREGHADLAAIDAVTLALLAAAHPGETIGTRILTYSQPTPGLPLVTSLVTDDDALGRLRQAAVTACDPGRPAARRLLLDGVAILDPTAYEPLATMQRKAEAMGYPVLA